MTRIRRCGIRNPIFKKWISIVFPNWISILPRSVLALSCRRASRFSSRTRSLQCPLLIRASVRNLHILSKTNLHPHDYNNALPIIELVSHKSALPERVSCSVPPAACCAPGLVLPSRNGVVSRSISKNFEISFLGICFSQLALSGSSSMGTPSSTAPVSRRDRDAGRLQCMPAVVSAPIAAQEIQRIERPQSDGSIQRYRRKRTRLR